MPKYVEMPGGGLAEFPDDMSEAQITAALTKSPPSNIASRAYSSIVEPATRTIAELIGGSARAPLPGGYRSQAAELVGQKAAELLIPQTPTQAAAAIGTAVGGPLAPVVKAAPAVGRVVGGAIGGATGGYLSGESPGTGAVVGGGGALGGELLGKVPSFLAPRVPGGRAAVNADDVARIGAVLPASLGRPKNATELWEAVVAAPRRLGEAKEAAVRELETMLPGGPPSRLSPPSGPSARPLGPTEIDVPSLGQTMTLREANAVLSQRGDVLRGHVPLDPRFRDRDPMQAYGQLAQEIDRGVLEHGGPEALAFWRERVQDPYKVGRAEIKPFQSSAVYQPGQQPGEAQISLPQVALWLRNPKNAAWMIDRVGPERFAQLANAVTRGAGPLATDLMEPGLGRAMDAARQVARGSTTGSMQAIGVPFRTPLPGIGRQYAGQQPYALPPGLRTILDIALQRAGSAGLP